MIDTQVAADADEPRLKIRPPVEGHERSEEFEKDILRQILGLVMTTDELVGDVKNLPPILANHSLPGELIAKQAARNQGVNFGQRPCRGVRRCSTQPVRRLTYTFSGVKPARGRGKIPV